jgi:hypothetical protein
MNVVGVVVLESPRRDPIRSKRHNGRRLRALHTYRATTTPPARSSKVRWSGRWDQQHDGVVLMVESICGQDFAYAREVEEDRQKKLVKLELHPTEKRDGGRTIQYMGQTLAAADPLYFIGACYYLECDASFLKITRRATLATACPRPRSNRAGPAWLRTPAIELPAWRIETFSSDRPRRVCPERASGASG